MILAGGNVSVVDREEWTETIIDKGKITEENWRRQKWKYRFDLGDNAIIMLTEAK
jgi:hypothetical protein